MGSCDDCRWGYFFFRCPISNQENYKRSICRYWMENGNCMRGDKCTYAHGNHELLRRWD
jgi:hypothetical protein